MTYSRLARFALGACLVTACASAGPHFGSDDDVPDPIDGRVATDGSTPIDAPQPPIDGPPIDAPTPPTDAPSATITLSQSSSLSVVAAASVACSSGENSYYRVFRLADHGITGSFRVERVDFGVQDAAAVFGGSQVVQVRLHTLAGELALANLTLVQSNNVTVANGTGAMVQATIAPPVTIPAGATLVAEVRAAGTLGDQFILGANTDPETQPGYLRGPACGSAAPVTFASISFPSTHIVLTVTGTM